MSGPIIAAPVIEPVSAEPVAVSDPHFMRIAWRSLRSNPVAFVSVLIVLLLAVVAVFAPLIAPHNPLHAYSDGLSARGAPISPGQIGRAHV